jgi:hypothetical protein
MVDQSSQDLSLQAVQGVAMLSGVLRSDTAVAVNKKFGKHDEQLGDIFKALRHLISQPPRPKRKVGFRLPEDDGK